MNNVQEARGTGLGKHGFVAKYKANGRLCKLYDPKIIGERRMQELNLQGCIDIDVEELGRYSSIGMSVIVALIGLTPNRVWKLIEDTPENRRKVWGHAYVVKGKSVKMLGKKMSGTLQERLDKFEAAEGRMECGRALFRAGMGQSIHKKVSVKKGAHYTKSGVSTTARPTAQGDVCSAGGMSIMVKRFGNSRLTCVYKTRNF